MWSTKYTNFWTLRKNIKEGKESKYKEKLRKNIKRQKQQKKILQKVKEIRKKKYEKKREIRKIKQIYGKKKKEERRKKENWQTKEGKNKLTAKIMKKVIMKDTRMKRGKENTSRKMKMKIE